MSWWMGFGPYVGRPDTQTTTPDPGAAPAADLASRSRARGCSPTAARAVHGRTWNELQAGWTTTSGMLREERSPSRRLALVVLRAALLDEMEAQHSERFAVWVGEQYGSPRRRR